jgi:ATP-binding cassette subfamily B protein
MIMIALLALFFMKDNNNWQMVIPSLGALALGAQRVLPALQQVYAAWASIIGYGTSSEDVILSLDELALKRNEITNTDNKSINFKKSIIFKNISFTYSGTKSKIINELDFKILKGDNVAITGRTGDGKSTLLDIITGLLLPSSGDIFVDGIKLDKSNIKQWQKNIALVPQVIFLTDESIIKNVCLGVHPDLINLEKVKDCLKKVQLTDFIQNLPLQYDTEIGERGVRLSGGQRQRIGIARALYKDANLLILDEATNALDQKTEKMILNNIKKLRKDITIIIISHRPQTLTFCNKIISLNKAKR